MAARPVTLLKKIRLKLFSITVTPVLFKQRVNRNEIAIKKCYFYEVTRYFRRDSN